MSKMANAEMLSISAVLFLVSAFFGRGVHHGNDYFRFRSWQTGPPVNYMPTQHYTKTQVILYSSRPSCQACTVGASASNQLHILHHPKSIKLSKTSDRIDVAELHKIIASSFGLLTQRDLKWNGLQTSLFSSPKANVLLTIPGFDDRLPRLDINSVATYPLNDNFPYIDVASLTKLIEGEFLEQEPLVLDLSLDKSVVLLQSTQEELFSQLPSSLSKMAARLVNKGSILHQFHTGSLNLTDSIDLALLAELQLIQDVIDTLVKNPKYTEHKSPDFLSFTISSLQTLVEQKGANSEKVADAVRVISSLINQINLSLHKLYHGNYMMEVVTMATSGVEPKMRVARSLMAQPDTEATNRLAQEQKLGISEDYGEDYPIIFNIILWLMVVLVIATFVIAHSIWFMDPGRDSIIYRMTSQRMKKDN